jgi:hypothetical protein
MNFKIQYHKWQEKEYKTLNTSIRELLNIESLQFYMPLFSLFFYIHNKPKANNKLDLKRNYYLREITEITKSRYYNSNMFLKGNIYDQCKNIFRETELFCKSIPIVDPIHCINNNYNFVNHINHHLPSNYNHNTFHKINDINNTAYIDVFCSYLFGNLTYNKINPSFPIFYGSVNGVGDYNYDLTEDYLDLKNDKCFNENIDKGFKLDIYGSDSESDSDRGSDSDSESDSDRGSGSGSDRRSGGSRGSGSDRRSGGSRGSGSDRRSRGSGSDRSGGSGSDRRSRGSGGSGSDRSGGSDISSDSDTQSPCDDCVAILKQIPIQMLFIEKLQGTLEDLIDNNVAEEVLKSCMFQVSFALTYLQKHFVFTHNDLHINNVMFEKTENKYLYYKYNNIYYRVPTHGYIFKIIDFGRAIFKYRNKIFMNDVFSDHGEAGGQYSHPSQIQFMINTQRNKVKPNFHFDLCRLSMTILEEINENNYSEQFIMFLHKICINRLDMSFCNMSDDFNLYKSIARDACNCLPREIIMNDIFKEYRIKKKLFPRKSFYTV